jgi:Na+/H+ antiporter NhaD/arsenite permease-like protein
MTVLIIILFTAGYLAITVEHFIKINKAATALLTGVLCWVAYALLSGDSQTIVLQNLSSHVGDIASILFFLLGAMTIVELIDAHDGFDLVLQQIQTTHKKKLLWQIATLSFFLSAVLDNLTTTIVMISLVRKIITTQQERWLMAGVIVIAANAGGAFSPIGDVTTTMLWMGQQITTHAILLRLFIPSLVCAAVSSWLIAFSLKGNITPPLLTPQNDNYTANPWQRQLVFWLGIFCLLLVPVFKGLTGLPPYMGVLFALGLMWVVTELIHSGKDEEEKGLLSVHHALRKIDTPSILFFLGILLSVAALQTSHILTQLANGIHTATSNTSIIAIALGLLSAVVDNVPLVAAVQSMYTLQQYSTDHPFWLLLAYCTGTGGSILIIGSAAGVAAMGIEQISFFWYLKKIGGPALIGYLLGVLIYLL